MSIIHETLGSDWKYPSPQETSGELDTASFMANPVILGNEYFHLDNKFMKILIIIPYHSKWER